MTPYEQLRVDKELKTFAAKNFEKPLACRNSEQIRFYRAELRLKITEYESKFNYAPAWAYNLLERYNVQLNSWQKVTC